MIVPEYALGQLLSRSYKNNLKLFLSNSNLPLSFCLSPPGSVICHCRIISSFQKWSFPFIALLNMLKISFEKRVLISSIFKTSLVLPEEVSRTFYTDKDADVDISGKNHGIYWLSGLFQRYQMSFNQFLIVDEYEIIVHFWLVHWATTTQAFLIIYDHEWLLFLCNIFLIFLASNRQSICL